MFGAPSSEPEYLTDEEVFGTVEEPKAKKPKMQDRMVMTEAPPEPKREPVTLDDFAQEGIRQHKEQQAKEKQAFEESNNRLSLNGVDFERDDKGVIHLAGKVGEPWARSKAQYEAVKAKFPEFKPWVAFEDRPFLDRLFPGSNPGMLSKEEQAAEVQGRQEWADQAALTEKLKQEAERQLRADNPNPYDGATFAGTDIPMTTPGERNAAELEAKAKGPAPTQKVWRDFTERSAEAFINGLVSMPRGAAEGADAVRYFATARADDLQNLNRDRQLDNTFERSKFAKTMNKVSDEVRKAFPGDKTRADEFIAQLGQGGGSMLSFMVGGAAVRSLGIPSKIGTMATGAGVGGVGGMEDAEQHGADTAAKYLSFLLNAGIGTSEAIPIDRALHRLNMASGGKVADIISSGAVSSLEEMLQEVGQQIGGNEVAKVLYDNKRDIFEGVGDSAKVAGVLGFLTGGGFTAAKHIAGGEDAAQPAPPPPAPEPELAPDEPSAEPLIDVKGQLADLHAKDSKRMGVYLPKEGAEHAAEVLKDAKGVRLENFDGKGGVVIARTNKIAKEVLKAREAGVPMQAILGKITGAGEGKPADGKFVVQQLNKDGAVVRESLVNEQQLGETEKAFQRDGHTVKTVSVEDAVKRRDEWIAHDKGGPPPVGQAPRAPQVPREFPGAILTDHDIFGEAAPDAPASMQVSTQASDAQKAAGNYKKGHVKLQGLDITIENPKGSERTGKAADGTEWSVTMPAAYGYVKRTKGADGDQVDVFLGPKADTADKVFVIDQVDPETGNFDEHKAVMGVDSADEAAQLYHQSFSDGRGGDRIANMVEMSVEEFKTWARSGNTTKPLWGNRMLPPAKFQNPARPAEAEAGAASPGKSAPPAPGTAKAAPRPSKAKETPQPEAAEKSPGQPVSAPLETARGIARRDVGDDEAITSSGRRVPVTYAVVEAADLVPSQGDDGQTNAAYPSELQPRDRERRISATQVHDIASRLEPKLLDKSPKASDGAPIIAADGVVESGNGRVLAIRRAYDRKMPGGEKYREHLKAQGYPVDGMEKPVLVRVRKGELGADERQTFTREANERDTLAMSAPERAMADAAQLSDAVLSLYRGGDLDEAGNREFTKAFLRDVVAKNDQGNLVDEGGRISQEAVRRMGAALLAKAYGDADLISALTESTDINIKGIGNALLDVAGTWAQMRGEASDGKISKEVDQTRALLEAVRLVDRSRREGKPLALLVGQNDIFSGTGISVETEFFLALMFRDTENWKQPVSRRSLSDALTFFVTEARKTFDGTDLLGETAPPARDILVTAKRKQTYDYEGDEGQQAQLFTPRANEGDGRADVADAGEAGRAGEGREPEIRKDERREEAGEKRKETGQEVAAKVEAYIRSGTEEDKVPRIDDPKPGHIGRLSQVVDTLNDYDALERANEVARHLRDDFVGWRPSASGKSKKAIAEHEEKDAAWVRRNDALKAVEDKIYDKRAVLMADAMKKAGFQNGDEVEYKGKLYDGRTGEERGGGVSILHHNEGQPWADMRLDGGILFITPRDLADLTKINDAKDVARREANSFSPSKKEVRDQAKQDMAERERPRRNAIGSDALEDALSPEAQKALAAMFKKRNAGRDLRYIREAMEVYQRLLDMSEVGDAEIVLDAAEAYFTKPSQDTAAALQDATWRGLQTITGDDSPDPAELLENEIFADTQEAGRLIFDTLDPKTASFDTEEFNTAFGMVEFRRDQEKVFPKPKEKVRIWKQVEGETIPQEAADAKIAEWKAFAKRVGKEEDHSQETILSLFDVTGQWSQPYVDAGYNVIRFDIKKGDDLMNFPQWMNTIEEEIAEGRSIVGILAAPPCTSFAVSGTQWWKSQHDIADKAMVKKKYGLWAAEYFDTPLDYANTLVAVTKLIVEQADPELFYVAENPIGRIQTQNGLPDPALSFDPHNFGNPYTKRTQLWGEFNTALPTANVEATQGSLIHKLRGDVEEDKAKRSETPEGFAYAFFMANNTSKLKENGGQVIENPPPGSAKPAADSKEPEAGSGEPDWWKDLTAAGRAPIIARVSSTLSPKVTWNNLSSDNRKKAQAAYEAMQKAEAKPSDYGAKNKLVSADRAAELRAKLQAKLKGQLNAGIDPEMLAMGAELAAFHIEAGARKFADFARAVANDLGSTVEKLRPYLRSWYNGARDMMEDNGLDVGGMDDAETVKAELRKLFEEPGITAPEKSDRQAQPIESAGRSSEDQKPSKVGEKINTKPKARPKEKEATTGDLFGDAAPTAPAEAARNWQAEGKAAFEAGKPRMAPADIWKGVSIKEGNKRADAFLKGWDRANLDAPVPVSAALPGDFRASEDVEVTQTESGLRVGDVVDVTGRTIGRSTIAALWSRTMMGRAVDMARIVSVAEDKQLIVNASELQPVDGLTPDTAKAQGAAARKEGTQDGSDAGTGLRAGTSQVSGSEQPGIPQEPAGPGNLPEEGGPGSGGDARTALGPDAVGNQQPVQGPAAGPLQEAAGVGSNSGDRGRNRDNRIDPAAVERNVEAEREAALPPNYQITDDDHIGEGGPKAKVAANLEALRLLKQLEAENRKATPSEQAVLVRYVGWGAFAQDMFQDAKPEWAKERQELKTLLTSEEYESARASVLNAHYTSAPVIRGMWTALMELGFVRGGRALEPASGVGHFLGLAPPVMRANLKWTTTELDKVTGAIARQLYQRADVNVQGFETLNRPNGFYDLAISNVPFGSFNIRDTRYKSDYLIHDYFFIRALDLVRPGGIVAFITSSGTMDKANDSARAEIMKRGDLIGAIRLPGGRKGAFAGNAGTDVTTDIIFLRRKGEKLAPLGIAWQNLKEIQTPDGPTKINEYFADHPEMMLGQMRLIGTMYRDKSPVLEGDATDIEQKIADAAKLMPENVYVETDSKPIAETKAIDPEASAKIKEGAFYLDGEKVMRKVLGVGTDPGLSKVDAEKVKALVAMRDKVAQLLDVNRNRSHDDAARGHLNKLYDAFVKKFGPINKETVTTTTRLNKAGEPIVIRRLPNMSAFRADPDAYKVAAIENYDAEKGTATKAALFKGEVVSDSPSAEIKNTIDGIGWSLNAFGQLNLTAIGDRLGLTKQQVIEELGDRIFLNPNGDRWEPAEQYLAGDVVEKLDEARAAAEADKSYERNVNALREVQPTPLTQEEITVPFGGAWVPGSVYEQYLEEVIGTTGKAKVALNPVTKQYSLAGVNFSISAQTQFGTNKVGVADIVSFAFQMKSPRVTEWIETPDGKKEVVNEEATREAQVKTQLVRKLFEGNAEEGIEGWVWGDPDRAELLAKLYNRKFNRLVPQKFDGSHLTFPGLATKITDGSGNVIPFALRDHQKAAVWRAIQNGNTLLDHVVGAGKTFTMIAAAMEMKRLGQIQRPMFIVPNHMLEQFSREFLQAYPNANILVAQKDEMTRANRKAFAAKIAAERWDGIVITHDAFGRLPLSQEAYVNFMKAEIEEIEAAIRHMKATQNKQDPTVKQLEQMKKRAEVRLKKLIATERKDDGVLFEELGVDQLILDEAHLFKNLQFYTQHTRVKGLSQAASQRAMDLFLKVRELEKTRPGRSSIFATGTPISNTMAEMYTMQRYLQLDELVKLGIDRFDAWAATFGEIRTNMELSPDGRTFRETSSFSRFSNLPELVALYSKMADTKTADMLNLPRPKLKGGKPIIVEAEPSLREEDYISGLVKRAEEVRGKKAEKGGDNMLKVVSEGRKVALDYRLIDPEYSDQNPEGKVAKMTENVVRIWKEGNNDPVAKAQLIFLDMGVPFTEEAKPPPKPEAEVDVAPDDELIDDNADEVEEVSADESEALRSRYNLYEEIRRQLVKQGIPRQQIAFIHEAKDDSKKAALFEKVRRGEVRVLLGSTSKMGVGTNVQKRLKAMHHLDAPWKPAEVEQRDGRILRQGNMNPEIEIYRYITKRSFDSFMWQTLERKANFIAQIKAGARGVRIAEDIDSPLPEAAELKAAASGDPRIMQHAELTKEVRDLEAQFASHVRTIGQARRDFMIRQEEMEGLEKRLPKMKEDAAKVPVTAGDKFKVELLVGPKGEFTKRAEAGAAVAAFLQEQADMLGAPVREFKIARFNGLDIKARLNLRDEVPGVTLSVDGYSGRGIEFGLSTERTPQLDSSLMSRMESELADLQAAANHTEYRIEQIRKELPKVQAAAQDRPFPRLERLKTAKNELAELTKALGEKKQGGKPTIMGNTEEQAAARKAVAPWRKMLDKVAQGFGYKIVDTGLPFGFTDNWGKFHSFGTQIIDKAIPGDKIGKWMDSGWKASPELRAYIRENMTAPWAHRVWFGHDPLANLSAVIDKFGVSALPDYAVQLFKDSLTKAGIPLPGVQWLVHAGLVSDRAATAWLSLNIGEALSGGLSILGTYRLMKQVKNGQPVERGWAALGILFKVVGGTLSANPVVLMSAATDMVLLARARPATARAALEKVEKQARRIERKGGPTIYGNTDESAPTFYSALVRAVDGIRMNRAPAAQWLATLKNQPGVKQEEMDWIGLGDWLNAQQGHVTKEAVQAFVRANQVEVRETLKGEIDPKAEQRLIDEYTKFLDANNLPSMSADELVLEDDLTATQRAWLADFSRRWDEVFGPQGANAPRYNQYQLPGGKNYRELLLALPAVPLTPLDTSKWTVEYAAGAFQPFRVVNGEGEVIAYFEDNVNGDARLIQQAADKFATTSQASDQYRSGHWTEPNVFAHVRFNEREVEGKRTLFIEEIQSDWHQQGRKRGYRGGEADRRMQEAEARVSRYRRPFQDMMLEHGLLGFDTLGEAVNTLAREGVDNWEFDTPEARELARTYIQARREQSRVGDITKRVPDAPFKTSWPEVALKRMIRWAAEKGFDSIAWTPGKVQAERYNLSRVVDQINFTSRPDSKFIAVAVKGSGYGSLTTNLEGKVLTAQGSMPQAIVGRQLDEVFGKPVADQIMQDESGTIEGDGLRIGGSGMIGFYDKMLVDTANKLGKKFGAKASRMGIIPRFGDSRGVIVRRRGDTWQLYDADNSVVVEDGLTWEAAVAKADKANADAANGVQAHILPITPEMRRSVMEGMPLFEARQNPAPRIRATPAQLRAATIEVRRLTGRMLGRKISAYVAEDMPDYISRDFIAAFDPHTRTIFITMRAASELAKNVGHETLHALRRLGVITDSEWSALVAAAKKGGYQPTAKSLEVYRREYVERWGMSEAAFKDMLDEEAVARLMGDFVAARENTSTAVQRIIDKLREWADAVLKAVGAAGVEVEARDFLRSAYAGDVARREASDYPELAPVMGNMADGTPDPKGMAIDGEGEEELEQLAGNINLRRLNAPDDIKTMLKDVATEASGFMGERRGVISNEQTAALAAELGLSVKELLARPTGAAFNAEQIFAARSMLLKSAERVKKLAARAKTSTSMTDLAEFQKAVLRHRAIQEQIAGITAEAGRALQQFNMIAGKDYIRGLDAIIGGVKNSKATFDAKRKGDEEMTRELAEMIDALSDPAQIGKFIADSRKATWGDMIREVWINSLLSGPRTHAANIVSNTLTALWQVPETAVAAALGSLHGGERVTAGEASARLFGLVQGAREGLEAAGHLLKTGEPRDAISKLEAHERRAVPGKVGEAVRIPSRLLEAEDQFFKAMAYRAEINALAHRQATFEGRKGQDFQNRIKELVTNPSQKMQHQAHQAALYQTFQNKLGPKGQWVMNLREAIPGAWLVLPFIRTPANILKYAAERTPLGLAMKPVRDNLTGKNGNVARDVQAARMLMGTAIMASVVMMVGAGLVTGGAPDDPDEERILRATGWQPYSIKVGDTYVSYQRLDPIALIVGIAAESVGIWEHVTQAEGDKVAAMLVTTIANNIKEKTWISGLVTFNEAFFSGDAWKLNAWANRLASSVVPQAVAQYTQSQDPFVREARSMLDAIKARVPGYSSTLVAKRNVFGEQIKREGAVGPDILSPFFVSTVKDNPVAQEMLRVGYFPSMPNRVLAGHKLTAEQYDRFVEVSGKRATARLNRLISSSRWNSKSDTDKQDTIRDEFTAARKVARDELRKLWPELRKKVEE